ncbi:hypothetical protein [Sinorhizobium meliloti]|uniref:hypothetical protein n=1 Tax=Rhizobium meliloti TaxID=382 RepID=UPI000B49E8AF|nr:hypothetical protein [Sinorhizobium meliloti]ASP66421.1 hypothetical protein CDO29_17405 [Sinorhizobium meliloti]MQX00703.1 hypothetical protein [Sinorhizobium meliloti]RVK38672.1 hypothetical protein CN160_35250 [Sinorhizobium meliloti]
MKVFWSWQSDRTSKVTRNVVEDALRRALLALGDELELDPSDRPELDHDTRNSPGMAAIADTIFNKIKQSAVFVGDVTSVGKSDGGRDLPNPNVLIELGWAWAHLSHENIILVANKSYGPKKPEQLPFDIRHRRAVVFYQLAKDADADAIESTTVKLSEDLREALRLSLTDWLAAKASAPGPSGKPPRSGDPSVWFEKGTIFQHQSWHGGGSTQKIGPVEARRIYARVVPEGFANGIPRANAVHTYQGNRAATVLQPIGPCASIDGGLNTDGVLRYAVSGNGGETWSAAQWFRDTGEIWSFDTHRLAEGKFYFGSVMDALADFVRDCLEILAHFEAIGHIRIEVGAVGLLGTVWPGQFADERSNALLDTFRVVQSRRRWDEKALVELMADVSSEIMEAYGRPNLKREQVEALLNKRG